MTERLMRAKFVVVSVVQNRASHDGPVTQETVSFSAVSKNSAYPEDGADEDNSFARWSPSASLSITIANPNLFGKFKSGDKLYADFTPAE